MRRIALIAISALSLATWAWAQTAYNAPGGLPANPYLQNVYSFGTLANNSIGTSRSHVQISGGGAPVIAWTNSSATADQHTWQLYADATTFHVNAVNDANSAAADVISGTRTGSPTPSIQSINIGSTMGSLVVRTRGIPCATQGCVRADGNSDDRCSLRSHPAGSDAGLLV